MAAGDFNVFVIHKEYGYPKPRFTITAFDKKTGEERWCFSELRSSIMLGFCSSPVVSDSIVFFGWGEGKLYAFHAQRGVKLWEDSLSGDICASPAIDNHTLYVATSSGKIVSYVPGPEPQSFKHDTYCYPNPAPAPGDNVSNIQVYVTMPGRMDLVIYNTAERPVFKTSANLPAMSQASDAYTYSWNLKNVANGVYFAKIVVKYNDGGTDKKVLKIAILK